MHQYNTNPSRPKSNMNYQKTIAASLGVLLLAGDAIAATGVLKGNLRREVWGPNRANVTRAQVVANTAGNPDIDAISLTSFEAPAGWADNYVQRVSGVFMPPTTGRYVFFVNSDDDADLFLNLTNDSPAGKVLIAQETAWSNERQWNSSAGSSPISQKRSDQWSPDSGTTVPYAQGIQLTAGTAYYIEGVHHEGTGGDNFAATFKLINDPDPLDTDEVSKFTGNVIGVTITLPTAFGIRTQVANETAHAGTEASFSFVTTNNASPDVTPSYQWYRNGVMLTNATGTQLTFLATAADNGAKYSATAKLGDPINQTLTSAEGTLTVLTTDITTAPGLKLEFFDGATRNRVLAGDVGPADSISVLPVYQIPVDASDSYATRISGYFIPPTSGDYVFFLASDDDSNLYLSTDTNAANKRLIAQEEVWSGSLNWVTAGGGNLSQKRSDQWSPDGAEFPWANGIPLVAGNRYYIETVHTEGGGGDNLAVTYILKGAADPVDGDWPKLAVTNNNIEFVTGPVSTLTIATQPQDITVFAGQNAAFTVVTSTDGELTPKFQWYRNDQVITNATANTYRLTTAIADNGAQFKVVATYPIGSLVVTSRVASLTVRTPVFEPGLVKYERFDGATRATVENNTAGEPNLVTTFTAFEGPLYDTSVENFAARLSGLFIPPTTGRYVFFVNSDDDSDLFISTDDTAGNKQLVAQESGWSGSRNWVGVGGGSTPEQKRSDMWMDANGNQPWSAGIQLTAGQKYYIEAVMHDGTSGDNIAATYKLVTEEDPLAGDAPKLVGNSIGFYAPTASYVAFTQQPQSVTANSGATATFTANAISDSQISIGGNPNQLVMYQWYKNGSSITNATTASYTTPLLTTADNNAQFLVAVRALGIATWSNSTPATLTVVSDTEKPTITYVGALKNLTNAAGEYSLSISFSELMDSNKLAQVANYGVPGAAVNAVTVAPNMRSVALTLSGAPTSPTTVTVNNVTDFSGNTLASPTGSLQQSALTITDVGTPGVDPVLPSVVYQTDADGYTISAQGSDIWNNADGFAFLWEQKTGNFDVAVRHKTITKTSHWAKGGLMVRESLNADSRNWNIVNDPRTQDPGTAPDGTGAGANVIESNSRTSTGGASAEFNQQPRDTPPAYPNAWVRIARTNDTITTYYSTDNAMTWVQSGVQTSTAVGDMTALPATLYVGIAVTAHNNDDLANVPPYRFWNTAEFDDYNSNFVPAPPRPALAIAKDGAIWKITFTGTLQSSATANGPYSDVAGATSPYTVDTSTGMRYFRSRP